VLSVPLIHPERTLAIRHRFLDVVEHADQRIQFAFAAKHEKKKGKCKLDGGSYKFPTLYTALSTAWSVVSSIATPLAVDGEVWSGR
jgi:hypothetical protein